MKISYGLALAVYVIILLGLLFYILIFGLGMTEDAEFTPALTIITTTAVLTVVSLISFPYLSKKSELSTSVVGILNTLFIQVIHSIGQRAKYKECIENPNHRRRE